MMVNEKETMDIHNIVLKTVWSYFEMTDIESSLPLPENLPPGNVGSLKKETLTSYVKKVVDQLQSALKSLKDKEIHQRISSESTKTSKWKKDEKKDMKEPAQGRVSLNPSLIQVRADKSEIDRRISAFIERKQQEVDENNKREFCSVYCIDNEPEDSCARTDAVFMPGSGGKSHVKVSRVVNSWGPQTRASHPTSNPEKSTERPGESDSMTAAVHERLQNMERHTGIRVNSDTPNNLSTPGIFQRIKDLEERILYLESLSPEYFSMIPSPKKLKRDLPHHQASSSDSTSHIYRGLSMSEINERISSLQHSLKQKETRSSGD